MKIVYWPLEKGNPDGISDEELIANITWAINRQNVITIGKFFLDFNQDRINDQEFYFYPIPKVTFKELKAEEIYTLSLPTIHKEQFGVEELAILRLETGGIVGIDASFLANTEEDVYSPFEPNVKLIIKE